MIDIRINNTPLDLASDTEVQITATSPIFDPNNLERVFSLPFSVPSTPRNLRTRRHAQRLDAANKTAFESGRLSIETHHIVTGRVSQTSAQNDREEITIANTPLEIWKALQKIKISEILDTFDLLDGESLPFWAFGLGSPGSYSITVDGTVASASAAGPGDIATAGASLASQLNAAFTGIASYDSGSNTLTLDGFIVKEHPIEAYTTITLNSYKNIALYHYNAVRDHLLDTNATPIASHCFPVIRWKGLYGQNNATFEIGSKFVNNAEDGNFWENQNYPAEQEERVWQNAVIPMPRVPYILEKIGETLGSYTWVGSVWGDADFQKLFVVNNFTLDAYTEDQYDDLDFYKRNSFTPEINLNKHVPAITAADFITALCNTFSLYLRASEGQLEFVKKQTAMTAIPMPLDGLVDARYRTEPNSTDGWRIAMSKNDKEAYTDDTQLVAIQTGTGEGEILTANTLHTAELILTGANLAKVPYTDQPGACPVFETNATRSTMPLCLLFCHELQETFDNSEYLFASHDGINYDGDTVGAYSLSPAGASGLYQRWHKGVVEYTIADSLIVTGYFHIGQVQQILTWATGRGRYYHPEGQIVAAFQEIQISARSTGLSPTRIKFLY